MEHLLQSPPSKLHQLSSLGSVSSQQISDDPTQLRPAKVTRTSLAHLSLFLGQETGESQRPSGLAIVYVLPMVLSIVQGRSLLPHQTKGYSKAWVMFLN